MEKTNQEWEDSPLIKDLQGYFRWLNVVKYTENDDGSGRIVSLEMDRIYYRGQADKEWTLTPSVFRKPYDEGSLLQDAHRQCWAELSRHKTWTEKLILLQHYGLPTRLLDVTFNPLVALYFACCDKTNKRGAVYCGYNTEPNSANEIAEVISFNLFNLPHSSELASSSIYINTNDNRFYKPFLFTPTINSPRIAAQNGAFLMAPFTKDSNWDYKLLLQNECFNKRRAVICANCKEKILHQLSTLGINRGSLFVTLSDRLASITENQILITNKYSFS